MSEANVPPYDALSFITRKTPGRRGGGYNYWDVKRYESYSVNYEIGERLADEYLAFIGAYPTHGNSTLLGCIVRDMIDQAKDGDDRCHGVHLGFLRGVNRYAMWRAAAGMEKRAPAILN